MTPTKEREVPPKSFAAPPRRTPILSIISVAFYGACIGLALLELKLHPELGNEGWGFGALGLLFGGFVFSAPIPLMLAIIGFIRHERPLLFPIIALLVSLPGAGFFFIMLLDH